MPFRISYFRGGCPALPAEYANTMFDARKRAYAMCDTFEQDGAEIEFIGASDDCAVMIEKIHFNDVAAI
jgi:hypothetical protein